MNNINFIYKFISRKAVGSEISYSFILPVIGILFGTVVIALTFAIMDGMEDKLFGDLKAFTSPAKLRYIDTTSPEFTDIQKILCSEDIPFYTSIERNAVVKVKDKFRVVHVRAIDKLDKFMNEHFDKINMYPVNEGEKPIFMGISATERLNLSDSESVKLLSLLDVSLISGIPPEINMNLAGIFYFDILDLDLNYVFIPYDLTGEIFTNMERSVLLLDKEIPVDILEKIISVNSKIEYITWKDDHQSLISAMRMEKIAYSFFGFLIIILSSFNLLSMMSMTVMRKVHQIGILMSMGYSNIRVIKIFFFQAFMSGVIGTIFGIITTIIIINIEKKYKLISEIFTSFPLVEFPLILNVDKIGIIAVCTLILVLLSAIYPAKKILDMKPIEAIEYIK